MEGVELEIMVETVRACSSTDWLKIAHSGCLEGTGS